MADQVDIQLQMTAAEYFARPETNAPEELIQGELVVSSPPTPEHQRAVAKAFTLIDRLKPNGEVFFAPIALYLDEQNVPEPDVVWVAENSRCTIAEKRLEGPPELVLEVHSPGTVRRDRREKYQLYEQYGVREYWLLDPAERYIEVYQHDGSRFIRHGVYGPQDTFVSPTLGGQMVEVSQIFPAE